MNFFFATNLMFHRWMSVVWVFIMENVSVYDEGSLQKRNLCKSIELVAYWSFIQNMLVTYMIIHMSSYIGIVDMSFTVLSQGWIKSNWIPFSKKVSYFLDVCVCFRQRNNKNRTVVHQHEKMDKGERKVMKDKRRNLLMMMRSKYLCCRLHEVQNRRLDRCINERVSLKINLTSLMTFLVKSECFWWWCITMNMSVIFGHWSVSNSGSASILGHKISYPAGFFIQS